MASEKGGNVIVALDNMNRKTATNLITETKDGISDNVLFKLNDLLAFEGMKGIKNLVEELSESGVNTSALQLMLDPKWNDIPNTVQNYLTKLHESGLGENTKLLTLMASGGFDMMKAAVEKRDELKLPTKLLAVTALTTLGDKGTKRVFDDNVKHTVLKLTKDALVAGIDGIVCSPQEATMLRAVFGDDFLIVTPGIRMADNTVKNDDQKRIDTPDGAVRNGSTHLVIGRPITQADDKKQALLDVLTSIDGVERMPVDATKYEFEKLLYTGTREELLKYIGAFYIKPENGSFVRLASGLLSDGYVNIGVAERNPNILRRAGQELAAQVSGDVVMGAQMGSIRLSAFLAKAMGVEESIYAEKTGEADDAMALKRHDIDLKGKNVVLSEDVITKATTTRKMIEIVKNGGGTVTAVTCLANRTGEDSIDGIPLFTAYTPAPFGMYYDDNTEIAKRGAYDKLPDGATIEEKPKAHRNSLVESMR